MPAEEARRIFERFYRVDPARQRERRGGDAGSGSGLGLSIVAAIVAAHDGNVRATSAPGEGMTITVRLPTTALPPDSEPVPVPGPLSEGQPASGPAKAASEPIA
jgi:two-component system OmpR family sensor kinase